MSFRYLDQNGAVSFWTNIKNYILSKVPTKTSELTNDSGYLTSHQSLSNYVTLNTAQEITNAKTFKDANTVRKLTSVEAGNVIPTSDKLISDIWQDKNGKELGRIYYVKSKSGTTELVMRAGDWFTSNDGVYTLDASGTNRRAELHLYTDSSGNCCIKPVGYFSATLKPLSTSVWLGESTSPFGRVYANEYKFCNAGLLPDTDVQTYEEHTIGFYGKNNTPLSYITFQKRPNLKDRIAVRIQTAVGTYKSYCFDATCFYPESNNSVDIGSTTNIFKNIYCNNYYKGTTAFGDIVTHNASEFLTSHQSLDNYVTLNTSQTISAGKTFSGNVSIYNSDTSVDARYLVLRNQKVKRGSKTETGTQFITFHDKDGGTLVSYETNVSSSGNTQAYINVSNLDANSQRVVGGVKVIKTPSETWFIPDSDNNVSLGLSNYKWKNVYATNYYLGSTAFGDIVIHNASEFLTQHPSITLSTNTTSTASPAHGGTFTCIDSVTQDTNGHITKVNTKTVTLPSDNNTDTKVKQYEGTTNQERPILSRYNSTEASQTANFVVYDTGVTSNPAKHTITASGGFIGKLSGVPSGTTNVAGVTNGGALLNAQTTTFGALWRAPTKDYQVACATYPNTNNNVYICYSVTNANVASGTNTLHKSLYWTADNGVLNTDTYRGNYVDIAGKYLGNESSTNGRSCLYLKANRDTDGKSGLYVTKFRQNVAQGSMGSSDVVFLSHDILENETRTNAGFVESFSNWENDVPGGMSIYSSISTRNLGTSAKPWTNAYITNLNLNGNAFDPISTSGNIGDIVFAYADAVSIDLSSRTTSGSNLKLLYIDHGESVIGEASSLLSGTWKFLGLTPSYVSTAGTHVGGVWKRIA